MFPPRATTRRIAGASNRHSATVGCGCKTSVRAWQGQPPPGSSVSKAAKPLESTAETGDPSSLPRQIAALMSAGSSPGRAGVLRLRTRCCDDGKDAGTGSSSLPVHSRTAAMSGSEILYGHPVLHWNHFTQNAPAQCREFGR